MRRIAMLLLAVGLAASAAAADKPTLYTRLGGYDGISDYVALVFPRVARHPSFARLFGGHGKDSQGRQFQMVVELVCSATGGPCVYTGRALGKVHAGLNITDDDWNAFMKIISDGMDEKRYSADVKAEFLEVWRRFRPEVVGAPRPIRVTPAAELRFTPLDPQKPKGPQVAIAFGDFGLKAPIGFFLKVPAGFRPGPHTHSSDDYAVVVTGKLHDFAAGRDEGPAVGPGGSWFQPGDVVHDNHCEDGSECIVFFYMPDGFDFKPAAAR